MQQAESTQRVGRVNMDNWRNHCHLSKAQTSHKQAIQSNTKPSEFNGTEIPRGQQQQKIRTQEQLMLPSKEKLNEGANKKNTCSK